MVLPHFLDLWPVFVKEPEGSLGWSAVKRDKWQELPLWEMHRNSNFPFMVEKEGVSLKTPGEEGWDAAAACTSPSSEQLGAASSLRTALALARPGLDPFPVKGVGHLGFGWWPCWHLFLWQGSRVRNGSLRWAAWHLKLGKGCLSAGGQPGDRLKALWYFSGAMG